VLDCDSYEINCLGIDLCLLNVGKQKYVNWWNCVSFGD
jgi:hypothetical protein